MMDERESLEEIFTLTIKYLFKTLQNVWNNLPVCRCGFVPAI